jgi:hypothetical protein
VRSETQVKLLKDYSLLSCLGERRRRRRRRRRRKRHQV